jgi:hypothetical protein
MPNRLSYRSIARRAAATLLVGTGLAVLAPAAVAVVNGISIPGGELAPGGTYQWLARFEVGGGTGHCTGILVAPTAVLTAAHCAEIAGSGVQVGNAPTPIPVSRVRLHPGWDGSVGFDAAILELAAPAAAQPLPVAISPDGLGAGVTVRVAGWGVTSGSPAPAEGEMRVDQLFGELFLATAAPSGLCDGDSGGPLLLGRPGADERLVGIASAGTSAACTDIIAVRATAIRDWLVAQTGGGSGTDPGNQPPQVLGGSLATTRGTPVEVPIEFSDPDGTVLGFDDIVAFNTTHGQFTR